MIKLNRYLVESIMKHFISEGWEPTHRRFFKDNNGENQTLIFNEIPMSLNTLDVINDIYLAIDEWKSIFEPDQVNFEPVISIDENDNLYFDDKVSFKVSDYLGYFTCIMGISIVAYNSIFNFTISSIDDMSVYIISKIERNIILSNNN